MIFQAHPPGEWLTVLLPLLLSLNAIVLLYLALDHPHVAVLLNNIGLCKYRDNM